MIAGSNSAASNKFLHFFTFGGSGGPLGVRIPAGNGSYTSSHLAHETSLFKLSSKSCLGVKLGGPAETCGTWSKTFVYATFLCLNGVRNTKI